ncbi:Leo1 protein [Martiniozyma asiatica (nom. inval.)]|nr:Leo1 protein [Martiniozyma asiatica]
MSDNELFGSSSEAEIDDIDVNEGENNHNDLDGYQMAGEEEDKPREITRGSLTIPRHARSHLAREEKAMLFPLPRFLKVDPEPFSPALFEEEIQASASEENSLKSTLQFKKLEMANTIRWRYAKSDEGLHKQTNCNIVEWEDGSMSLNIGKEMFVIKLKSNEDDLLAVDLNNTESTNSNEIELNSSTLMGMIPLSDSIQVVPPGMNSKAHKLLASTIKQGMKRQRGRGINTIVTKEDPEAKAREVEKALKEVEKARKRQLLREAAQEERERSEDVRMGSSAGYGIDAEQDDEDDEDDEDYGDGFVVEDEDEEIEMADDDELDRAAERLKQVKRAGASKYKEQAATKEEVGESTPASEQNNDNNNDDGNDDDDEDNDNVIRKKRRLVIEEDDDDDDDDDE